MVTQTTSGLIIGMLLFLVAVGLTLIFGVLNLLYFAHGEVFMVGAFVGLYLVVYGGANIYVALVGAAIACAALGIVAFYVSVRPVPKDRPLAPLISTIGLTIVLQNLAVVNYGNTQLKINNIDIELLQSNHIVESRKLDREAVQRQMAVAGRHLALHRLGDRGMMTSARIGEDLRPAGLDWITCLRAPAIQALAPRRGHCNCRCLMSAIWPRSARPRCFLVNG